MLNALREVEDALVGYRTDRAARDKLAQSVKSAELTLYLARERYTHELSDFIQMPDAQRTLVVMRKQLIQTNVALTGDVVTLVLLRRRRLARSLAAA